MSMPSVEAEPQIGDVLLGHRRRRQRHAGRVDAFVLAERPAGHDHGAQLVALAVDVTRSSIRPSSSSSRSPGCAE